MLMIQSRTIDDLYIIQHILQIVTLGVYPFTHRPMNVFYFLKTTKRFNRFIQRDCTILNVLYNVAYVL